MNYVNIIRENDLLEIKKRFSPVRQDEFQSYVFSEQTRRCYLSKLFSKQIYFYCIVSSINNISQPSIYHLIVERCLIDEEEMISLAHQFPNVKYLEL
jgi:hypothetical protein